MIDNIIKDRDKYIGGSDIPVIVGYNKFMDAFQLTQKKINKENINNIYIEFGQEMEPKIRDYINNKYKTSYTPNTKINGNFRANVDGYDKEADIKLLEIKTYNDKLDIEYYLPQLFFYMFMYNQPQILLVGYKRPDNYKNKSLNINELNNLYDFDYNNIIEHIIEFDSNKWANYMHLINMYVKALEWSKEQENPTEKEFYNIFYNDISPSLKETANKLYIIENQIKTLKELEKQANNFKGILYNEMINRNIKSLKFGDLTITAKNPYTQTRKTIKSNFEIEEPQLYKKYIQIKEVPIKGGLTIKYE